MRIAKTMLWKEMQATDSIDDNQALQDLSVLEIFEAFGLTDEAIECNLNFSLTVNGCEITLLLTKEG